MVSGKPKPPSLILKPTLNTKFHIDYSWWDRNLSDLRSYMLTHLAPEKRELFLHDGEDEIIDYIDPDTGEVHRLDALGVALQEAAKDPDFINPHTSLVDSVFRVFLSNGNTPLTPEELAEATDRDANTILKTLGGVTVYKGLRPYESNT